jgi:hypothetical protein
MSLRPQTMVPESLQSIVTTGDSCWAAAGFTKASATRSVATAVRIAGLFSE